MRRSFLLRAFFAAVGASIIALFPARAEAARGARDFLAPGILFGFSGRPGGDQDVQAHFGAELTFTHYPGAPYQLGVGAFTQIYAVGFDHVRAAIGPQVNYMFGGLELGLCVEQEDRLNSTSLGVQVAPFASIGFLSISFRIVFPFYGFGPAPAYTPDLGLAFSFKWPFPLGGDYIGRISRREPPLPWPSAPGFM